MKPVIIDTHDLRKDRQLYNYEKISKCIRDKNYNDIRNKKNCNVKELDRLLEDLGITLEHLVDKCIECEILFTSIVRNISIQSSRQGSLDETYLIEQMSLNLEKIGINIKQNGDYTATNQGKIIKTQDARKLSKTERLKSFDGTICNEKNEIKGWIFSKITYSKGGHQDNVFQEANNICEWVEKFYSDKIDIFYIIIDTDLLKDLNEIQNKFKNISNLFIGDHVKFQEYFINKKLI